MLSIHSYKQLDQSSSSWCRLDSSPLGSSLLPIRQKWDGALVGKMKICTYDAATVDVLINCFVESRKKMFWHLPDGKKWDFFCGSQFPTIRSILLRFQGLKIRRSTIFYVVQERQSTDHESLKLGKCVSGETRAMLHAQWEKMATTKQVIAKSFIRGKNMKQLFRVLFPIKTNLSMTFPVSPHGILASGH